MSLSATAQRDQFRALLDDLPLGVSVYRLDDLDDARSLRLVYSNTAAGRLTGLDLDQEVGKLLTEIAPGAWETGLPEQYADVVRTGEGRDFGEIVYEDARIRRAVYSVRAQALPDQSVSVAFEDVTERHELHALREAQHALAEAEARYRFLSEFLQQQIWTAEPDGQLDYVNRYVLDYFGRSEEEMIGAGWQEVVHPDDLPGVVTRWTQALETGAAYEVEFRLLHAADESFRWHLGRAHALKDDEGRVVKWFGSNTDVHEHKEHVEALALSEMRTQALFQAVTDVVVVYPIEDGRPGRLSTFNEAAVRFYGYTKEELATMTVEDLLGSGAPSTAIVLERLFREGRSTFQSVHTTRDGRRVPMETNARVLDLDGQLYVFEVCRDVTERRASEREIMQLNLHLEQRVAERTERLERLTATLAERERQLLNAQQLARVGSWSWNARSDEVQWSQALYDVLGLSAGDFEPSLQGYLALLPEADCERLGRIVETALQTGEPYALEHRLIRPDGTLRHISSRGEALFGSEGEVVGLSGVAQDVTDRVEAEEAVRVSEARLRHITGAAHDAIVTADAEGRIVDWNGSAEALFGYTAEEASGAPLQLLMPERFVEAHREGMARYLETGEAHVIGNIVELAGRHKDGAEFPIELALSTWTLDDDRFFTGVIRNISARKEAERELRRAHTQLQLIVDSAASGIYGLDLKGNTTFVNAVAVDLTGWSAEEMLHRAQHDLIHHHHADGTVYARETCPIYQVMRDGEVQQVDDEVFWRKDGTPLPVSYTSAPLFDGEAIVGAVVVFRTREHDGADA